jgi:hypothetical protein
VAARRKKQEVKSKDEGRWLKVGLDGQDIEGHSAGDPFAPKYEAGEAI